MSDQPKTCLQLWQEHNEAWSKLRQEYRNAISEARAREFPIGAQVTFVHGSNKVECTVVKHGEFDFQWDKVTVRNNKTKKDWEKEVQDLRHV